MDGSVLCSKEDNNLFTKYMFTCERLASYSDWPNDPEWSTTCTPKTLSEAGFVFKPYDDGPDAVICIFCKKEMEGWEEDDEPKNKQNHRPKCPFMSLRKPIENLKLQEIIKFTRTVYLYQIESDFDKKVKEFEEKAINVRETICAKIDTMKRKK